MTRRAGRWGCRAAGGDSRLPRAARSPVTHSAPPVQLFKGLDHLLPHQVAQAAAAACGQQPVAGSTCIQLAGACGSRGAACAAMPVRGRRPLSCHQAGDQPDQSPKTALTVLLHVEERFDFAGPAGRVVQAGALPAAAHKLHNVPVQWRRQRGGGGLAGPRQAGRCACDAPQASILAPSSWSSAGPSARRRPHSPSARRQRSRLTCGAACAAATPL